MRGAEDAYVDLPRFRAGPGLTRLAASKARAARLAVVVGPRPLKQFRDWLRVHNPVRRHAALLRPKFEAVTRIFERELAGHGIASWTTPRGGYFVSLDTLDGLASDVVRLADEAGVKLTAAGATFPHGTDPRNRNIRIAPTLPPLAQVELAMQVVAVSVLLASAKHS